MDNTITITGATGNVGGKTLKQLKQLGAPVRVIARRTEQVAQFASDGVPAVQADLDDTAALTEAFEGSDQVFIITAANRNQTVQGRNVVQAARDAGVRAITYLSASDASPNSPAPWARANWTTQELVKMSGLEWTILRPSAFMQNLAQSAAPISRGFYPQTTGRGSVAWTDTGDIARVAATILHRGVHHGTEPIITGPARLTSQEVARTFSKVLNRRVRYIHLPSRIFAGSIRLAGADSWTAEGLRQQFAHLVRQGLDGADALSDDVQRITGLPATSLEAWITSNRHRFIRR